MNEQALYDKLEEIEKAITNHVMTEIKENRVTIQGMYNTMLSMYESVQSNTENVGVMADRLNNITTQLQRLKIISK